MKILTFFFILSCTLGCAIKINTFYDKQTVFESYNSFCWLEGCDYRLEAPGYVDAKILDFLAIAIEEELGNKGITKNDVDPDFMIDFHVVIDEVETNFYHNFDYLEETDYFYGPQKLNYTFLRGSMVIDLVDRAESKMVWRVDIQQYLDLDQEVTKEMIRKGVKKAFKKFPPPLTN